MTVVNISVQQLQTLQQTQASFELIDVREPEEHAKAQIPGNTLIPLGTLPQAIATWDKAKHYVLYCHSGMRSAHAAAYMAREGFTHVENLQGGILAWEELSES